MTTATDDNARRAYWAVKMDEAYAFMGQIRQYPVVECGEPVVSLVDAVRGAGVEVAFLEKSHITYPWEFWHYNQGDAYDHYLNQTGQPARYGAVDVTLTDGSVQAIPDPLTLLNSYEEIESEMAQALERR